MLLPLGPVAGPIPRPERVRDHYATPAWVTEALLHHVRFRGAVWEPCCGTGAMSDVLAAHGYEVVSSDIADRGFGTTGVDFLKCRAPPPGCRSIVTNPPMAIPDRMSGRSVQPTRCWASCGTRCEWRASSKDISQRIQWSQMGERTNTAQHHHAWAVFGHAHEKGRAPSLLFA